MLVLALLVGILLIWQNVLAQGFDYTPWQQVLDGYVDESGLVDYKGLKSQPEILDAFVAHLAKSGPVSTPQFFKTRADSFAFWINAYNALVLFGVKEVYPISSVTQIQPNFGFFKANEFVVDGQTVTLDHIEHSILRDQFRDPRIHAVINCAARSCPRLLKEPFIADTLDLQLQSAIVQMVGSSQHVRFDSDSKTLYLSQIFNWFQSDFVNVGMSGKTKETDLKNFVLGVLPQANQRHIDNWKIVFLEYDWSLNDQATKM